jgi:hypothetical protein
VTSFAYFQGVKLKPCSYPTRIYILYYGYLNGLEVIGLYLICVQLVNRKSGLTKLNPADDTVKNSIRRHWEQMDKGE